MKDRYRGALLGLACGDAVGTTVEFRARGSFPPVTDMVGGGPFQLEPGQWTDDTSMALCLAESLVERRTFDAQDQMTRYLKWWQDGYLSSTGKCFDIGGTVRSALARFRKTGDPFSGSTDPRTAGNGSLMRLAPAVLFGYPDPDALVRFCVDSSRTTHAAAEALDCCRLFGGLIGRALDGEPRAALARHPTTGLSEPAVIALAEGHYLTRERGEIRGSGYCVESLEAALWCFQRTESFESAVLDAVNLGDDADTTAAIVGQLAGAHYGVGAIPAGWLAKLYLRAEIERLADDLMKLSRNRG